MKHEEIKTLIAAYIEGELDKKESLLVEAHLRECAGCRKECEELNQLEEVLNKMELRKSSKDTWDVYWSSVYNKLERRIGWIFLSLGVIILAFWGGYQAVEQLMTDPGKPLALKIGILALLGGGIIVFVSILREQLFFRKKERYKEIRR
jgi:hypothetical protein